MKKQSTTHANWSYASLILAAMTSLFLFSTDSLQAQEKKQDSLSVKTPNVKIVCKKSDKVENPLVIIDKKELTLTELNALPPENIRSINVLKDEKAIETYGEKAKYGVIIVTTKTNNAPAPANEQDIPTFKASMVPVDETLVIMDGKIISHQELQAYDPKKILSVEVLKDQKSLEKYEARDKKGVILVTTANPR